MTRIELTCVNFILDNPRKLTPGTLDKSIDIISGELVRNDSDSNNVTRSLQLRDFYPTFYSLNIYWFWCS